MPTNSEKEACLEILREIENRIPKRRYARHVQEYLKHKGHKEIPGIYKIQAVRNGRQYDLDIMKALQEISHRGDGQPRDENDNPIPPEKWKDQGAQLSFAVK